MGLVPEFFVLLGIDIFLAMSLLSAFLDDDLSSRLQYIFQIAAVAGLGELLMGQGFGDLAPYWASILYLAFALSSVVGLNVYLAVVRRKMTIVPAFSGAVTVPTLTISALFVYSFLGSEGEVGFTLAAIVTLAVLTSLTGLSIFGFLWEMSKRTDITRGELGPSPTSPVPTPPKTPGLSMRLHLPSMQGEEWEESPKKEKDQE